MMTHPDELFRLAMEKLEQTQRDIGVAHLQTCAVRHWLAQRVRHVADSLEPETLNNPQEQLLGVRH
jgi:hypothetical protein